MRRFTIFTLNSLAAIIAIAVITHVETFYTHEGIGPTIFVGLAFVWVIFALLFAAWSLIKVER